MNDHSKPPSPTLSIAYSATAELTVELAKMLALVSPTSMSEEQQELWLRAAADALDGIRAHEVRDIAAELKRSVTRHNQIVPEIAKLVDQKRKRTTSSGSLDEINAKRRGDGLPAIHWVQRDGRMVCEFVDPPECSLGKRVK
jgi:hypothetical protein